ncbi:MAG TPA: DUF6116 family protein [Methylomirabilota bacterium]|nr:DUF6116 family protein [Methylomirabilota bacterium]
MSPSPRSPLAALVEKLIPGIRFPWLLVILAGLLAVDLVVPDPIPLLDEVVLAVLTFLAASWRRRGGDPSRPIKDVTPPDEDGEPPPRDARDPH